MEPQKLYCPYCSLELAGDRHKNEHQAWVVFSCEYNQFNDEKRPITELVMNEKRLAELTQEKQRISSTIKSLKARNLELQNAQ